MSILRVVFFLLAVVVMSSGELSAKEKIRMHKEWLEKHVSLRMQHKNNSSKKTTIEERLLHTKEISLKNSSAAADTKHFDIISTIKQPQKGNPSLNDVYPETEKQSDYTNAFFKSLSEERTTVATVAETFTNSTVTSPVTISEIPSIDTRTTNTNHIGMDAPTLTTVGQTSLKKESSKISRSKTYPRWGPWSAWSKCSRSCGGGISYQERKCFLKLKSRKRIIGNECVGLYRRYHLCNTQDCPANELDFRYQQCMVFNNVLFQGTQYKWESYVKDDAQCELNCKPIGMKYFATLKESVIDGTSCSRPAEYYRKGYRGKAICLSGICKANLRPLDCRQLGNFRKTCLRRS